jgi:phosphate transport system substrate-binding protein
MFLRYASLLCLFVMLLIAMGCGEKKSDTAMTKVALCSFSSDKFIIAGSGTNLAVTGKLAAAYTVKTGIQLEVPGSIGSDGAINAVRSEKLELGLISKHLTAQEQADGLKELPYARVGIVFGVHKDVPDISLSTTEIIDILNGSKTNWSDGTKICVFVREPNDSSTQSLYTLIPDYKEAMLDAYQNRRWEIVYRDSDMTEAIGQTKGAFGLTAMTEIQKESSNNKAIAYNGFTPTPENIRNGNYTLTKELSFVYKNQLSARATKFIDFVFSAEGKTIISKWGAIPLER